MRKSITSMSCLGLALGLLLLSSERAHARGATTPDSSGGANVTTNAAPTNGANTSGAAPNRASFDQLLEAELSVEGGLTADDVARRTSATSPSVRGRTAELDAARAALDQASLAYLPTTTLSGRYTRLSDTQSGSLGNLVTAPGAAAGPVPAGQQLFSVPLAFDTPINQYALSVGVSVPLSDYLLRIGPARASAELGVSSATDSLRASRRQVAADARLVFYDWVRARLSAIVAEQALDTARAHLGDARTAFSLGSVSSADVLRLESQVARSELLVLTSRNLATLREAQLRTLQHDADAAPYRIGEDVRKPATAVVESSTEALWTEAVRSRPELRALIAQQASQNKLANVARAAYVPRVDVFGNAQYSNPNSRVFPAGDEFRGSWDAGVQLTWVLSDAAAASARTEQAEGRARAIYEQRGALSDAIRMEVISAQQAVSESAVSADTSARGLAAAEESYRARRLLYQNGRATTVELLDAEAELTRARLDALGAHIDARVAAVRLAYAVGH
ncbi:MAG: TolC family protein [Deltaproteobacteria bacterium]